MTDFGLKHTSQNLCIIVDCCVPELKVFQLKMKLTHQYS